MTVNQKIQNKIIIISDTLNDLVELINKILLENKELTQKIKTLEAKLQQLEQQENKENKE